MGWFFVHAGYCTNKLRACTFSLKCFIMFARFIKSKAFSYFIADTYGTEKECPLLGGVRYSEVNLEGFHRIGSQIVCPLLGGVRYSACPLFRGFTVL